MTASSALRCLSSSAGVPLFAGRLGVGDSRRVDTLRRVFLRGADFGLLAALRVLAADGRFAAVRLFGFFNFLAFAVVCIAFRAPVDSRA